MAAGRPGLAGCGVCAGGRWAAVGGRLAGATTPTAATRTLRPARCRWPLGGSGWPPGWQPATRCWSCRAARAWPTACGRWRAWGRWGGQEGVWWGGRGQVGGQRGREGHGAGAGATIEQVQAGRSQGTASGTHKSPPPPAPAPPPLDPQAPPDAWMSHFMAALADKLPACTPQALSNTLWALARLGVRPGGSWLAALLDTAHARLGLFNAQELSNSVTALARMGLHPGGRWLDRWGAMPPPPLLASPPLSCSPLARAHLSLSLKAACLLPLHSFPTAAWRLVSAHPPPPPHPPCLTPPAHGFPAASWRHRSPSWPASSCSTCPTRCGRWPRWATRRRPPGRLPRWARCRSALGRHGGDQCKGAMGLLAPKS